MQVNSKRNMLLGLAFGLAGATQVSQGALLTLDVQAVSTQIGGGQATAVTDAKNVSITAAGETVNFNVYALITDGNGNHADDSIANVSTRFTSTEAANGLMGNINSAQRAAAFSSFGNNGVANNLDGNPDLEWGGTSGTSTTGNFTATTTTPQTSSVGDGVTQVLLGSFAWTLTGDLVDGTTTVINAAPFVNSSSLRGTYTFVSDGTQHSNANNTDVGAGLGVALTGVVPEPASMSLIGLGTCGVLARRRRTKGVIA